jgi:hypothetical protein
VKCIFDMDRKAFYMIPVSAADRNVINTVFNMTTAGDFVLLVRQDVPQSDGVVSHLEVSRFNYNAARPLSVFEFAFQAQHPDAPLPDPRSGSGTKRSRLADYVLRRQALQSFIVGLLPGVGDVAVLPLGTTVADPEDPIVIDPGPTTPPNPVHTAPLTGPAKG